MSVGLEAQVEQGLNTFCARNALADVSNLRLLTGGANMELWAFDAGDLQCVLRRYRNGTPPENSGASKVSIETEASTLSAVRRGCTKVPKVVGVLTAEDALGPGYVMERIEGESLPQRLFRDPSYSKALEVLPDQLATELAAIHRFPVEGLFLPKRAAQDLLDGLKSIYDISGYDSPMIALAFQWLSKNLPAGGAGTCLVHGDFRMGNVLVSPSGLTAILDWELVHIGVPEEDIAWFCMPSWRFGKYDNIAGGIAKLDEFLSAYERAGGLNINKSVLQWYLIYSSLSWGASIVLMAHWWRNGDDKSLERILIGTRISEVELDLLLLLEDAESVASDLPVRFEAASADSHSADVAPDELIGAAQDYLSNEIVPSSSGAAKFHARIAANALSIAGRLIRAGGAYNKLSQVRLQNLGLTEQRLVEGLRCGDIDWKQADILDHLRHWCLERLSMHQPKYAAIKVALEKWR